MPSFFLHSFLLNNRLLNENHLQSISDEAFQAQRQLDILVLSDNPIKTIGHRAFSIPDGQVVIFMIRTQLKAVSLRVFFFPDFHNLTTVITMNGGQIGTMKFLDSLQQERCTFYLFVTFFYTKTGLTGFLRTSHKAENTSFPEIQRLSKTVLLG
ncbi:unnamed protein product [Porites evermanni]|uniref:Uncharacterized protein n=1 Tax=Porites evermanni TaxID=104178 RepID=A0ABN8PLE4_9CNID|nr:unnamed protein product [Porites evermanni]